MGAAEQARPAGTGQVAELAGHVAVLAGQVATRAGEIAALAAQLAELATDPEPTPGGSVDSITAVVLSGQEVRIDWTSARTDVVAWRVGRDGTDLHGSPPWSTTRVAAARSHPFTSLRSGQLYTFTVVAVTAAGELAPATVTATPVDQPQGGGQPGDTAAQRHGWGEPHEISDEFGYSGAPDPRKWILPGPDWAGHEGRGRRRAELTTVRDGRMVLAGLANGDGAWVRQRLPTRYGRWEIRARAANTGSAGAPFHVLALIWPLVENWPRSGEYDWLEIEDPGQGFFRAYLHYPHPPASDGRVQQEIITVPGVGIGEWHCYGFEWTPEHLRGFIDGEVVYTLSGGAGPAGRSAIQTMPAGQLTLQTDNFHSSRPCEMHLDWVRFYPLRDLL